MRKPFPVTLSLEVTIRDLRDDDLTGLAWTGGLHRRNLATQLERARTGLTDYLVACLPSELPVGKGGIDYEKHPGAGTLMQFAVLEPLRSCGIGSALILAAEDRVRARGLGVAEIEVEVNNPRAQALYERIGYTACGRLPASWDQETSPGVVTRYETVEVLLRKNLQ